MTAATLYQIKPRFQAMLRPIVNRAARSGIRPNHLTVTAIGVSALAGVAVSIGTKTPALLWAVPLLYLFRMMLNAMDGLLAREHAMTSPGGAILNEVGDVVSDAVAYSPYALLFPDAWLLVVAVVVLGLIAEVTALAAADESGRRNDGPLGKSDRALAFGVISVLTGIGAGVVVVPVLIVMIVLGLMTIHNRAGSGPGETVA